MPLSQEEKSAIEKRCLEAYRLAWQTHELGELPQLITDDINSEDRPYGHHTAEEFLGLISGWLTEHKESPSAPPQVFVNMRDFHTGKPYLLNTHSPGNNGVYTVYLCDCNDDGLICRFPLFGERSDMLPLCCNSLEEEEEMHKLGVNIFSPQWLLRRLAHELSVYGDYEARGFAEAVMDLSFLTLEQKYILLWVADSKRFISLLGHTGYDIPFDYSDDLARDIYMDPFSVLAEFPRTIQLLQEKASDITAIRWWLESYSDRHPSK